MSYKWVQISGEHEEVLDRLAVTEEAYVNTVRMLDAALDEVNRKDRIIRLMIKNASRTA